MKKFIIVLYILFNSFFIYPDQISTQFYSEGGDVFNLIIKNDKIFLTNKLVLHYLKNKNIYYQKKIISKNPGSWDEWYKEYTISLIKNDKKEIVKVFFTLKTCLYPNMINKFTKIFYKKYSSKKKYKYNLKLLINYSKNLTQSQFNYFFGINETFFHYVQAEPQIEIIENNDHTITYNDKYDGVWSFILNQDYKNRNIYSNEWYFPSCLHDYSFMQITKTSKNFYKLFYYDNGDGLSTCWYGLFNVENKTLIDNIVFNDEIGNM